MEKNKFSEIAIRHFKLKIPKVYKKKERRAYLSGYLHAKIELTHSKYSKKRIK